LQGAIAITDYGWYTFLSARPQITEVNFWTPSARAGFRAEPFSPFLFKLKAPHNAVCGFAYFAQYSRLPDWLAWEVFEEGNGCESFEDMRQRIREIRSRIRYDETTGSDEIGCIQLVHPVFFPANAWVPQPSDWRVRTQRYAKYDLSAGEGLRVWSLLMLCSPQNPTGGVLSRAELEAIAEIVAPYEDLWIYSDEVYSGLVYDGRFESIAAVPGMRDRVIIVDSASKTYAMTGWRIGYAANAKLAPCFTRWVTNTDSCPPHPNQYAVVEALNGPQDEARSMRDVFLQRRDRIVPGLNEIEGVRCLTPGGAFYVWPNVTEMARMVGAANSEELRKRLLHEAGVAVLADIHFGRQVQGDGDHLRFSYASSFEAIDEGLSRLADFVKRNKR